MSLLILGNPDDVYLKIEIQKLLAKQKTERKLKKNKVDQHLSWFDKDIPKSWIMEAYKLNFKGKNLLLYR